MAVEDGAQVFVFLYCLDRRTVDHSGDRCRQFSSAAGEGHHHLLSFADIQLQAGRVTPLYKLLQSSSMVRAGSGQKGQENCVVSKLYQMTAEVR